MSRLIGVAVVIVATLAAAGCGGGFDDRRVRDSAPNTLAGDGISVDLPNGWTGRIVIGASGRPVLHAASFPVEPNDTDVGEVAREAIGTNGMYLNVRDVGAGDADSKLPIRFDSADFDRTTGCCRLREASRDVESDGELYRVSAVSGGDGAPPEQYLADLNEALASLRLEPYQPPTVEAAAGAAIDGYGLHARLPKGWQGGIGRGEIHAGDDSIDVQLDEYVTPDAGSFVTGRPPIEIGPAEFVHPQGGTGYETGRSFLLAGRSFQLWVRTPNKQPDPEALAETNAFLASFTAQAGDFYPGTVEPATFEAASGWHTGSTGAADVEPQGEQTQTWAATVPYRDDGFQFPPHETLAALPADGVVILAQLTEDTVGARAPEHDPPFVLGDFSAGGFEGVPSDRDTRVLNAHVSEGYDVALWAFFGREHATKEQLAEAQAEIDRLRLPQWPDS